MRPLTALFAAVLAAQTIAAPMKEVHAYEMAMLNPWSDLLTVRARAEVIVSSSSGMNVFVAEPDTTEIESPPPVLIFLKGFYPTVGLLGYIELLSYLAHKGIVVVAPIYAPDSTQNLPLEIFDSLRIQQSFDSRSLARQVYSAIQPTLQRFPDSNVVMYGHSFGALLGLALGTFANEVTGAILDGFPDSTVIQDRHGICTEKRRPLVNFPTTILRAREDHAFESASTDAFECIDAPFKQLIEIESYTDESGYTYRADHFSPFSTDPRPSQNPTVAFSLFDVFNGVTRNLLRDNLVNPEVQKIHGYIPTLETNMVDEYSLRTLLPALAFATSSSSFRATATELMYGSAREFAWKGQKLRKVVKQAKSPSYEFPENNPQN